MSDVAQAAELLAADGEGPGPVGGAHLGRGLTATMRKVWSPRECRTFLGHGRHEAALLKERMPSTAVTTVILRFRDLNHDEGETIKLHNEIVSATGHTWWGWWEKSGETVPDEVFRDLLTYAKSGDGLDIYLLDTGRQLIFHAKCVNIHWDKTHEPIASPEPAATPQYYREKFCRAWFKLKELKPVDAKTIATFAYVDVDDFFTNKQSRYKQFFDNKIVFDPEELTQQNRTIWFVRPTVTGDRTYKVSLLDPHRLAPSDFPPYEQSQSNNILWVSDLHFGPHHEFPTTNSATQSALATAIANAAEKNSIKDFAGIIVSGDITWQAAEAEFKDAQTFLTAMASHPSGISNYRIAVCPGNYDLAFSPTPDDKSARIVDDITTDAAKKGYTNFYESLFFQPPNEFLASGRRLLVGNAAAVEIACLNSSYLQQSKGWFQGIGFIGNEQLKFVAKQFGWTARAADAPKAFRILVLHHHLLPVLYRGEAQGGYGYSVVIDAEAVVQWIVDNKIDLVLHGHMHAPFCAKVSRPVDGRPKPNVPWHDFHVLGLGSTGVKPGHRKDQKNMFGVLMFGLNHVVIKILSVATTDETEEIWSVKIPLRAGDHGNQACHH